MREEGDEKMKQIGDTYIMRGQILEGTGQTQRLQLFDGKYTTAFKVVKFVIAGIRADDTSSDCVAKLMTKDNGINADFWDWNDSREIGWASTDHRTADGVLQSFSLVDPSNLIVEDLFITAASRSSANPSINYYLELEKYEVPEFGGLISLIKNKAQGFA